MIEKKHSFKMQGLFENIERLIELAESGNYDANQRVNTIKKLANPVFDFSFSDYKRILDKKLPIPVKKGMKLFEMMRELNYLVQPIGKKKGSACFVRRIEYEKLTWKEFIELRGVFSAGFIMKAFELRATPNFNGLDMLNEKQKELYGKIGVYFGNKKKPTLQSLAINLLSEETDGKDFSERSLYIYLEAVEEYQKKRKNAAGFNVFTLTFQSVTAFNNERTIRESLESMDKVAADLVANISKNFSEMGFNLLKNVMMQNSNNLIKNLIPQFQSYNFSEMIKSIITNQSSLERLTGKNELR